MREDLFSFLRVVEEPKPRYPYVPPPEVQRSIPKPPREFNYLRIKQKGKRHAH